MLPFVAGSMSFLAIAVLLAVLFIVHMQYVFVRKKFQALVKDKPLKGMKTRPQCADWCDVETNYDVSRVVMHYPAPTFPESTSSLSLNMAVVSARKTYSTPILQARGDTFEFEECRMRKQERLQEYSLGEMIIKCPLHHSSSFLATNSDLPVIDISNCNYDAYRHKVIETVFRERYDNYQPPGNIVMNSIHLNTARSSADASLENRYKHSFLDFIEIYDKATKGLSKQEMEYLHPLDHFLVKGMRNPETLERATETVSGLSENLRKASKEKTKDQFILYPITNPNSRKRDKVDNNTFLNGIDKSSFHAPSVRSPRLDCIMNTNITHGKSSRGGGYVVAKVSNVKFQDTSILLTTAHLSKAPKKFFCLDEKWKSDQCPLKIPSNSLYNLKKPMSETPSCGTDGKKCQTHYTSLSSSEVEITCKEPCKISTMAKKNMPYCNNDWTVVENRLCASNKMHPLLPVSSLIVVNTKCDVFKRQNSNVASTKVFLESIPPSPPQGHSQTYSKVRSRNFPLLIERKLLDDSGQHQATKLIKLCDTHVTNTTDMRSLVNNTASECTICYSITTKPTLIHEDSDENKNVVEGRITGMYAQNSLDHNKSSGLEVTKSIDFNNINQAQVRVSSTI